MVALDHAEDAQKPPHPDRARERGGAAMSTYRATITFDLPDGDSIDACTAATMLGERLFSEVPDFAVTSLAVERDA